jgi:type IV pilus assembly protein PilE
MARPSSNKGFTLIELVIVVAVIAALAAIAYPNYFAYVQRSNRASAKAALEQAAQFMERQYTATGTYPGLTLLQSNGYQWVGGSGSSDAKYEIALPSISASTYTLSATPQNVKVDPVCGTLTLDNIGNRTSSSGISADCWAR